MKPNFRSERGQSLVLIVFAIIGMIGMTALAVDGGNAYAERRRAQSAADASALDAALARVRGGNLYNEALARAASNRYTDNDPGTPSSSPNINVEVYNPPINLPGTGPAYVGNSEYIQVVITSTVRTYFGRVVGISQVTNKVMAIARGKPGVVSPMAYGNAVVSLSPHTCKAIQYNGNSDITLIGSGIFVNSDCADAAFFNNAKSPGSDLSAPCLQAVGGITYAPGSVDVPSACINSGVGAWGYPPSNIVMPDPQCTGPATVDGQYMHPGTWDGAFPPNGVTELLSGIYCVNAGNQGFHINGGQSLTGHNVVIRMNSGDVSFNGGATINLDAPDTGPFAGLLIYLPMTNDSPVALSGNGDSNIVGSVLAPASDVTVSGGSGTTALHTQVIGYTVTMTGSSALTMQYDAGEQYFPPMPPTIELVQ